MNKKKNVLFLVIVAIILLTIFAVFKLVNLSLFVSFFSMPKDTTFNKENVISLIKIKQELIILNKAIINSAINDHNLIKNNNDIESLINNIFKPYINISEIKQNGFISSNGVFYKLENNQGTCSSVTETKESFSIENSCATLFVDINGQNLPNKFLKNTSNITDRFVFYIYENAVAPAYNSAEWDLFNANIAEIMEEIKKLQSFENIDWKKLGI